VRAAAAVALLLAGALPARAGELAVEAQIGYFDMAAKDSAEALFGSSGGATLGGAVRYTLWRGAFVSAGLRTFSREGERVYLASPGSAVQKLGFPVSLTLRPFLLTAGYRFRHGKRIVPYAHVGAAITSWSEESTVAGESFDDDGSKTGFVGAAGVEVGRGLLRFGVELGYSSVTGALGTAGVSQLYGEDAIGGFHAIGKVGVTFGL
jgi:opacity protein-like surface antigen